MSEPHQVSKGGTEADRQYWARRNAIICPKHPRYQGKRAPKSCDRCWRAYVRSKPQKSCPCGCAYWCYRCQKWVPKGWVCVRHEKY